jgi:hypothetical protein
MPTLANITMKNQMKTNQIFRCLLWTLALILWGAAFVSLKAQNTEPIDEYKTVFSRNANNRNRISGFGSVINELSIPSGGGSGIFYSVGGEGAVLFNQRFYIGGYSLVSLAPSDLERNYDNEEDLHFLQIGGLIGYKIAPNKPIHLNIGTRIGYAGMLWQDWRYNDEINSGVTRQIDGWMVSPQVKAEVNFFPWMQVSAGVGYRWVFAEKQFDYNPSHELNQATFQLGVSFGYFR